MVENVWYEVWTSEHPSLQNIIQRILDPEPLHSITVQERTTNGPTHEFNWVHSTNVCMWIFQSEYFDIKLPCKKEPCKKEMKLWFLFIFCNKNAALILRLMISTFVTCNFVLLAVLLVQQSSECLHFICKRNAHNSQVVLHCSVYWHLSNIQIWTL